MMRVALSLEFLYISCGACFLYRKEGVPGRIWKAGGGVDSRLKPIHGERDLLEALNGETEVPKVPFNLVVPDQARGIARSQPKIQYAAST
ncbi:hypothetical protein B0T16DRAFT_403742 [Cercophora newfieldiana]|uniref:Uncharacterized protein n=1 Tax=Cercophora newfieldiana TaxID=92897 RepID=A0AA39YHZ2_9PEZI|nr:hypothetical protein B0T16DRAFT_403742 [Cercophora newfieldiana]